MKFKQYFVRMYTLCDFDPSFLFSNILIFMELKRKIKDNDKQLVQILQNYWQWWGNSPEDNPDNNPECSIRIDTNNSLVFLQNPFETGNTSYDYRESYSTRIFNTISVNYFILFSRRCGFLW